MVFGRYPLFKITPSVASCCATLQSNAHKSPWFFFCLFVCFFAFRLTAVKKKNENKLNPLGGKKDLFDELTSVFNYSVIS